MLRIKGDASSSSNRTVPLKQVHVSAKLRSFAADVTLTQVFRNDESVTVEAVYCFPIEANAAIYAFVARIDNEREIVAQLKEKQAAQQEYSEALAQGHGAYLLEQDEASNDIFIISVGALQAGSECHITISYVSELDLLHSTNKPTIRFVIPTTIAPRYTPEQQGIASPGGTQAEYVQSVPYTIEFDCHVEKLDQNVTSISSPSHPIKVDSSNEENFLVTFSQQDVTLDRDIIVDVELSEVRKNTIAAIDNGAVMISFIPTEQDCQRNSNNGTNEFLFVIDCSGSMAGEDKIGLARKAMLLFLKSLPTNCRFNIIRFGSNFQALFNDQVAREYNEGNMREAEVLIKGMTADLGGTELVGPLQWLKEKEPSAGGVRQIFLLTDGEVSNVDQVTKICCEMATHTRIFSFGLGYSPSRALVKGLAHATNGFSVFVAPQTNLDIYVAEQLTRALQPSIANVNIKWNTSQPILHKVPQHVPPVFFGDRLLVYALLDETTPFDHTTTVELSTDVHQQPIGSARIDHIPPVLDSRAITRLAAKALLRELVDVQKSTDKKSIVNMSIKYGILCPYTAFIGVEKRLNASSESNADMELREVPLMIRHSSDQSSLNMSCYIQNCSTLINDIQFNVCASADVISCLSLSSSAFSCKATSLRKSSSLGIGSIMQPVTGFISSLFSRKKRRENPPPSTYSTTASTSLNGRQSSDNSSSTLSQTSNTTWPTEEQKLVERFIDLQQYDGLWILTENDVQELTGKVITSFSSSTIENLEKNLQQSIITTTIVLIVLKTRCSSKTTLWQALSNKAKKRLEELLGGDQTKLDQLMKDIQDQL